MTSNVALLVCFGTNLTHSPGTAWCRKRVGQIWCKCNQNLETSTSSRATSNDKKSSIGASITKDNDDYSPHETCVCSNEPECVAFVLSKNFTQGLIPQKGTPAIWRNLAISLSTGTGSACVGQIQQRPDARRRRYAQPCIQTD